MAFRVSVFTIKLQSHISLFITRTSKGYKITTRLISNNLNFYRFTEEAFTSLISIVFIIQAFEKIYEISHEAPITRHPEEILFSTCHCLIETTNNQLINDNTTTTIIQRKNLSIGIKRCKELGGVPTGLRLIFFKYKKYMTFFAFF